MVLPRSRSTIRRIEHGVVADGRGKVVEDRLGLMRLDALQHRPLRAADG
jgi:hypothetical protein